MAGKEVSIWVRVRDGFTAGLNRFSKSLASIGSGAVRAFAAIGKAAAASVAAISAAGTFLVASFTKQETAEVKLRAALRASGQNATELMGKYKALANEIQDTTAQGDEETIGLIALATQLGVTGANMDRAVKLQLALSATGMDAEGAMTLAAKAVNGNTAALGRMLPGIKQATSEAAKQKIITDFINTGLEVQAQLLNTTAGRWKELKGRLGDVAEDAGGIISGGLGIAGVMASISERVKQAGSDLVEWAKSGGWSDLRTGFKTIADAARESFEFIKAFAGSIASSMVESVGGGINQMDGGFANLVVKVKGYFGIMWGHVQDFAQQVYDAMVNVLPGDDFWTPATNAKDAATRMGDELVQIQRKAAEEYAATRKRQGDELLARLTKEFEQEKVFAEKRVDLEASVQARKELLASWDKDAKSAEIIASAEKQVAKERAAEEEANLKATVDELKKRAEAAKKVAEEPSFKRRLDEMTKKREEDKELAKEEKKLAERVRRIGEKQAGGRIKISKRDDQLMKDFKQFQKDKADAMAAQKAALRAADALDNLVRLNEANLKASGGPN